MFNLRFFVLLLCAASLHMVTAKAVALAVEEVAPEPTPVFEGEPVRYDARRSIADAIALTTGHQPSHVAGALYVSTTTTPSNTVVQAAGFVALVALLALAATWSNRRTLAQKAGVLPRAHPVHLAA